MSSRVSRRRTRAYFSQQRIRKIESVLRTLHNRSLKNKGSSVKTLAGIHRRSQSTIRSYLKFLGNQHLVSTGIKGLWFERPQRVEGPPGKPEVALRGYIDYRIEPHAIQVECVVLVANNPEAIRAGIERIQRAVGRTLSSKLAGKLHFGKYPLTAYSAERFRYRHHDERWVEFGR